MGMQIDETGRDGDAAGIDFFFASACDLSLCRDRIAFNRNVSQIRLGAAAIDNETIANY